MSNLTTISPSYFEPKTNLPIKVIVLDDTAKANIPAAAPFYYASGSIDWKRYNWLYPTNCSRVRMQASS